MYFIELRQRTDICLMNEDEKLICIKTGKTCFSKKDAGNAIRRLKTRRKQYFCKQKQIACRSYYCNYCGTYHLTHIRNFNYKKKYKNIL